MLDYIKERLTQSYFLITILLLAILPMLLVLFVTYSISQKALQNQVEKNLLVIANNKALTIDYYILKKKLDIQLLARSFDIKQTAKEINQAIKDKNHQKLEQIKNKLTPFIKYLIDLLGYSGFYFISENDKLAFSISNQQTEQFDSPDLPKNSPILRSVERVKTLFDTEMTDFNYFQNSKQPVAFIAAPVLDEGKIIGSIVLELNNENIYQVINMHTGSAHSIETIVGARANEKDAPSPVYLPMPLFFEPDHALSLSNPSDVPTIHLLEEALKGKQGQGLLKDYRGNETIAAWSYLPALRWGMIIKVDTSYAFAPIQSLKESIYFLALASILLIIIIGYFVSKRLRYAEDFLTNVINSMPSLMVVINPLGEIFRWNRPVETTLNIPTKQIKGQPLTKLFSFIIPYQSAIDKALKSREVKKIDKISYRGSEGQIFFEMLIYPLKGKLFQGAAILMSDITDKVKIAEEIQQQKKLASIGVLTAGIAHEINNPLNFISSSISSLRQDFEEIKSIIEKYSSLPASKELNEIDEMKKEMDFNYTLEEVPNLINAIMEGSQRTSEIVKNLRIFSRLDETGIKKANIHEGMDSALNLLKHTYEKHVTIVKEYGPLPEIECYPSKLNQVFMNVLTNSIQAIKEKGEIIIKTSLKNDQVEISIKDNGSGIAEEHLEKIFDPFFTTKGVGAGLGLGLSISYSIIEEHHGTISVRSQLGVGTEIIIILPVLQPN